MATLDEIFAAMPDTPAGGTHELLIIDPDTRQIYVPEIESIFGVVTDDNAEKKFFQCPRYVGKGIDLAACNLRIAYQNASGTEDGRDGYLVQDLTESGGYVYFSWELSEKVCLFQGPVQFAVCATQGTAVVWNTDAAEGQVLSGLPYNGEIVQTEMQDVIAQLLALVEAQSKAVEAVGAAQVKTVEAAAKAAQEAAVAEIEAKKQNVLAELPPDYTAMGAQVDRLTRSTAGAIVCHAEGKIIQVADASDNFLPGLRIFGKSTQNGTPTPDNPVEIVSTPAPTVRVCGVNLFDIKSFVDNAVSNKANISAIANGVLVSQTAYMDDMTKYNFGFEENKRYTVKFAVNWISATNDAAQFSFVYFYTDGTLEKTRIKYADGNAEKVITSAQGKTVSHVAIGTWVYLGECELKNITLLPGVYDSATMPSYTPYTGGTIFTNRTLPGIPVASGGNYTDADGQQWICDEVDLGRGVYIHRTVTHALTSECRIVEWNGEGGVIGINITGLPYDNTPADEVRGACSHFEVRANGTSIGGAIGVRLLGDSYRFYILNTEEITSLEEWKVFFDGQVSAGTPVRILLPAAEVTETPLAEAELATFADLRSVNPTTTILNDSGAHMAVEYVADTKLYIDRKLAELVATMNA